MCNHLDRSNGTGKDDERGFDAAAYWLHHNHPKTLASNLVPIAGSFGGMGDLVRVLYRILSRQGLIKSFLDNDGEICPDLVMEAAISPQPDQTLVVVD
ncbi:unnamed protein product [Malus baccata var. baccata]